MIKNKNLFIIIAVIVAILILKSAPLTLFSVTDLVNTNTPFIHHTSQASESSIGDLRIESETIQFTCKNEIATLSQEKRTVTSGGKEVTQTVSVPSWQGTVSVPQPRPECWTASLTVGDKSFDFMHNQKILVNPYFNITFDASDSFITFGNELISTTPRDAQGKITGKTEREWVTYYGVFKIWQDEKRYFIFEVDNSFVTMEWEAGYNLLRLNSNDNPSLIITNNLVNNLDAELLIKIKHKLTKEEQVISLPLKLKKGTDRYPISIPKEILGGITLESKLNVLFLAAKIKSKSEPSKTFNIIPNLNPSLSYADFIKSINNQDTGISQYITNENTEEGSKAGLVVILFIIVSLIIIKVIQKKNDH